MPKRSDRSSSNKEDARIAPNGRGVSKSDRTPRGGVSSAKPGGRSPRNEREAERTNPSKKQSDGITTSSGVDSAKPASSARADRDAHASPVIKCDECGKTDKLLRCSQCKRAWYCGAECQAVAWPQHYAACIAAAAQLAPVKSEDSESESDEEFELQSKPAVTVAAANTTDRASSTTADSARNSKKVGAAVSSASSASKGTGSRSPKSDCLACQGKHRPHTCKGRKARRRSTH